MAQRGAGTPAPVPAAVRETNSRFAGIWKLVGDETRDAKGQIVPGRPQQSAGYIIYDPIGYMAVASVSATRVTFNDRPPTATDARTLMDTYRGYWGSFTVNDARQVVTHQTFGSLNPAISGTDQVRFFSFAGSRLTAAAACLARRHGGDPDLGAGARSADADADTAQADRPVETGLAGDAQSRRESCWRPIPGRPDSSSTPRRGTSWCT